MDERDDVHALAMHRLHNTERTMDAVQEALRFDPKHASANALVADLVGPAQGDPDGAR